jgi:hypothetical protein
MANSEGFGPTSMGLPGVFVAVAIGVTVFPPLSST